jgi:serine/threonine protein kinase
MELIKGVDLDRILESPMGPVPADFISAVMVQALAGLHAAHETRDDDGRPLELVHRDLSPHNIMVGFDGRVKVLDFGVAKMRNQRSLTLPGIVKGKPLYMSPEQAAGEAIDRRSDIFSMGLLLHEAVVGSRAFERDDASASMMAIVSDPLLVPSGVHPALWKVIERALAKEPTKRYQTAQQMAEAVARAVPPMLDTDVGALVKAQFPHRVAEVTQWERTLSRAGVERKNLER